MEVGGQLHGAAALLLRKVHLMPAHYDAERAPELVKTLW